MGAHAHCGRHIPRFSFLYSRWFLIAFVFRISDPPRSRKRRRWCGGGTMTWTTTPSTPQTTTSDRRCWDSGLTRDGKSSSSSSSSSTSLIFHPVIFNTSDWQTLAIVEHRKQLPISVYSDTPKTFLYRKNARSQKRRFHQKEL